MNTKKTADILRETQTETTSKKNKRRLLLVVLSVFVVIIATALLILPAWTLGEDDAQQKGGIDVSMQQTETDAEAAEGADLQKNDSPEKAIKKAEADAGDDGDAADAQAPQDAAEAQAEDPDADPDPHAGADKAEAAEDAEDAEDAETGGTAGSLSGKGKGYSVTVTYDADAGIPEGAQLQVEEILQEKGSSDQQTEYEHYVSDAASALDQEADTVRYARFFDISIVKDGEEVQPAEDSLVDVKIELKDADSSDLQVVHFGEETEVLASQTDGGEVSFETAGFSVYAVVDAPEPAPVAGVNRLTSLDEIAEHGSSGLYMRSPGGFYFMDETYSPRANRTGIKKTKPASTEPDPQKAVLYYFEKVGDSGDQYRVYCMKNDQKMYIRQSGDSLTLTEGLQEDTASATSTFTISVFSGTDNTFRMMGVNNFCWNMQGGNNGNGFCANSTVTDENGKIQLEFISEQNDDPYGLDGKSFGIAFNDETVTAVGMMAEEKTVGSNARLAALSMLIRPDVLTNDGVLLVAENSDVTEWTFESAHDDQYYLSTEIDGARKYLKVSGSAVTLSDSREDASLITARPGTGENSGKWHFTAGNYSLNFTGSVNGGFNAVTGSGTNTWLNLIERSVLDDDDFTQYNAKKVSVSDTQNVYNGQQVVIYTRIWNDETKRYEFYAIDHDGSLVRCYDTGDGIEWIGSRVNTLLWDFTEYFNDDGTPNYYYELQNSQYGNYIAPQLTDGQILSDETIGVNMDGRRKGKNYTPIVAWDDDHYAYAGLKTENGHIVSCPLVEAEDFYFAVMSPIETHDQTSTVETIDGTQYGITMKMVDYNNRNIGTRQSPRDEVQNGFFGGDNNNPGLLSTDLDEDGYPRSTAVTGQAGNSLSQLYEDESDVNHLFIRSIYNESGYFEYDSTSNFAHLNDDGNFTVYDQIGSISDYGTPTGTHGQFLPYQDLTEGSYCSFTNQTDVLARPLPDNDPRKGEKLYNLGSRQDIDYQFGMEMEASFTQTASGLDAWGHDIIFEFSGDDDFWFYVDGELVLDLGGVHSAMTGSINFRTGQVTSSRGNSTLYEIFRSNYQARGLSESEIAQKLDEIFTQNSEGNYVFRDYTNHTMKMFYMERGAGASNLHMRFNLAAVKPGTFILSKKLSGTDDPENDMIEFPYQIYYRTRVDGRIEEHRLTEKNGDVYNAVYADTNVNVRYMPEFTPAGGSEEYKDVFFLKPGQSAEITLPSSTVDYRVVECGVNPDIYDHVKANDNELTGTTTVNTVGGTARKDFATGWDTLTDRQKVDYDNHVKEGAMRTLSIKKRLYDVDGETELHYPENETVFKFRLYLGDENADADELPLANMYSYYVKNAQNEYCRWDSNLKRFVSLEKENFSDLTAAEKTAAKFTTSSSGTISKIPADHTVEVRDLIISSQYKVEERIGEIPKGYTLREGDGYTRVDTTPQETYGMTPVSGIIARDEDPKYEVRNQKGWGLTVKKVWTDKDFMESHDDIYFAVYVKTGSDPDQYELYDDSVRRLSSAESEVYYFFDDLRYNNRIFHFTDFEIREVMLATVGGEQLHVDADGKVTGYTTVTPVDDNGTLITGGTPVGGSHKDELSYTVKYEPGESTGKNENIRTDTVTNSRPGVVLYKTDWTGAFDQDGHLTGALAGARFTLKDQGGNDVAAEAYTSDSTGRITIAYLDEGSYTLKETAAPKGYMAPEHPMTITVDANDNVSVSGLDEAYYAISTRTDPGMQASILIRNKPAALQAKKVDSSSGDAIRNVHFALYRQVTASDGTKRKDYLPMTGYEDLVTDENGILPKITMDLTAGTYYLTETETVTGYDLLTKDLCFTIANDGTVAINSEGHSSWLTTVTDPDTGMTSYTITIPNGKMKKVAFKKVDIADTNTPLAGASFDLYRVTGGQREESPMYEDLVSGTDGMLAIGTDKAFDLGSGTYDLVETEAPAGYMLKETAVRITVSETGVTYDEGTSISEDGRGVQYDATTGIYTLTVTNTAGAELPSSGGRGVIWMYVLGSILLIGCGVLLVARRRIRDH